MLQKESQKRDIQNCPLTYAMNVIGGKWRLPIIWALWKNDTLRYNELKRRIDGITNMMLSQVLKEMEITGLIVRKQYLEIPPRVEYSLTQEGKDLVPALEALARWGKHMQNR
ncbi:helix-turn-helix domain-containing protein [Brevibacillus nitrificans]|uniref:winged helix-turn-helix transcriptional regulator n=1 Tax=Brevibacillus nitrificans TaxID=651560 RepID=UPI002E212165|nr:helix-turn-helix domain-containing protein [Brevibacillus nitrificans]